ncbi:MAG: Holliday junction branch migration protein RuvA [Arenicellales bacterium]
MIGYLRGKILEKEPPLILLDVGGVGYQLEASMNTFYALSAQSADEVALHVHTVVREDAFLLYGFASKDERALFQALLKVNGVGPRVGLAILSTLSAAEFADCIHREDTAALVRVPGIGKKTAERLIVEMRDRLPSLAEGGSAASDGGASAKAAGSAINDAASALIALGFRAADASRAVRAIPDAQSLDSESLIRTALKALSS